MLTLKSLVLPVVFVAGFIFFAGCSSGLTPLEPGLDSVYGLADVTPKWLNMQPRELYIQGDTMVVLSDYNGILLYDISVPANPTFIKWVGLHSGGQLVFKDGYAYTLPTHGIMEIIDIDPPDAAHVSSTLDVHVISRDMRIYSDNLFLGTDDSELMVFDISKPGTAVLRSTADISPFRIFLAVDSHYLYTTAPYYLGIYDITNPDSPTLVRSIKDESYIQMTVTGNYGYVMTVQNELIVIDISDPPNASVVNKTEILGSGKVVIDGDRAYLRYTNGEYIQVIDISTPEDPIVTDNFDTMGVVQPGEARDGYLFCFGKSAGVEIFDIDPSWSGTMVNRLPTLGDPYDIAVQNGIVCAGDNGGLSVIDASTVGCAEIIASHLFWPCTEMTMDDNYVYFTYGAPGGLLHVYDYVNLGSNLTGTTALGHPVWDIANKDGYLYAAVADGGLEIINAVSPSTPSLMKIIDTGERTTCVEVAGDYVYAVDSKQGMTIIDISIPWQPKVMGNHPISGGKEWTGNMRISAAVDNGLAFVSSYDGYSGPVVNTFGDDSSGFSGGGFSMDGGGFNYTGKYIDVFDVSNPASPALVGTWDLNERAYALELIGPCLLKGDSEGLKIIDISGTSSELVLDSYTGVGGVRDIEVEGNYAYVNSEMGFRIIHLGTLLGGVATNPTVPPF